MVVCVSPLHHTCIYKRFIYNRWVPTCFCVLNGIALPRHPCQFSSAFPTGLVGQSCFYSACVSPEVLRWHDAFEKGRPWQEAHIDPLAFQICAELLAAVILRTAKALTCVPSPIQRRVGWRRLHSKDPGILEPVVMSFRPR